LEQNVDVGNQGGVVEIISLDEVRNLKLTDGSLEAWVGVLLSVETEEMLIEQTIMNSTLLPDFVSSYGDQIDTYYSYSS